MATQLPDWALWLQALAPAISGAITALVAVAVGYISYRQWRTAREKLVLDLFERRFGIFQLAKGAVETSFHHRATDQSAFSRISQAHAEASFLFGIEVVDYLDTIKDAVFVLASSGWTVDHDRAQEILADFPPRFSELAGPYMHMRQKL